MIETQEAQLAASCPNLNKGKLPGQPEVTSRENVSAVTTRGGKTTQDTAMPQDARSRQKTDTASGAEQEAEEEEVKEPNSATAEETMEVPRASSDYHDTTILPFPERRRKPLNDEQFGKFVEVIRKVYVNILLLDAMQVPTYSKYLKDFVGNKRTLPHTKMVQLTEECSAAILNSIP